MKPQASRSASTRSMLTPSITLVFLRLAVEDLPGVEAIFTEAPADGFGSPDETVRISVGARIASFMEQLVPNAQPAGCASKLAAIAA